MLLIIERNKAFTNGLSENRTTNKSNGLSEQWMKTDILEKLCMLMIIVCCVYDEEFYVYVHWYIEDSCYIVKECLFKYSRGYSCLLHTTGTLKKTGAHPLKCCCDFWRLRILLVERVKTQPEYWCVLSRVETLISCVKLPASSSSCCESCWILC